MRPSLFLADRMLQRGSGRSRTGSLSSPTCHEDHPPPPRLGVSGLYTDYLERRRRRQNSMSPPPPIPSPPPPPLDVSSRISGSSGLLPLHPPPPPRLCNGHGGSGGVLFDLPPFGGGSNGKRSAAEMSQELSRSVKRLYNLFNSAINKS
jgi:hypothetical protein